MKLKNYIFLIVLFTFSLPLFAQIQSNDPLLDKKIAEKFGLEVPPPNTEMEPAPDWILKADMIIHSGTIWKGYKRELKSVMITRKAIGRNGEKREIKQSFGKPVQIDGTFDGSSIKGVPLISHVPPSKTAFEQAHKEGFRVVPYVHFTDIDIDRIDQDMNVLEYPEILLKDNDGQWLHMPMDGTYRLHRILTCANSPRYWELSLAYIKKLMDWGADGVFIDNVHDRRDPCMAPIFNEENENYPGFRPWQHPSLEPYRILYNPEFGKYQHDHLFPNATHDYAYDRFLQAIRTLVKSYGNDKIVILNSGIQTPFQKNGDVCMWESFIYSWAWEGRGTSWNNVKKSWEQNKKYIDAGRRITGLSYLKSEREEVKEDAFWAFTCARLTDMIWWANLNGTGAEILYKTHLGKPLQPFQEKDGIVTRVFENGILVLNNNEKDEEIEITIPTNFNVTELIDVFKVKKTITVNNGKLYINAPGNKARIYSKQL